MYSALRASSAAYSRAKLQQRVFVGRIINQPLPTLSQRQQQQISDASSPSSSSVRFVVRCLTTTTTTPTSTNKGSPRSPMPRVLPSTSIPAPTPPPSKPLLKVTKSMAGTGRIHQAMGAAQADAQSGGGGGYGDQQQQQQQSGGGDQQQQQQQQQYQDEYAENKTPVTWTMLFLVGVAAASAVAYYRIERERRLERAMGKIVSSESDGWSPYEDRVARRQFVPTKYGWFPKQDGWTAAGKPAIGGPWSLVDLEGKLVTEQSFTGKWLLLYFGFARCPDICPSEMNKIAAVLDTLKRQHPHLYAKIVPLFVTVDPARDSIKALCDYARDFHPDYVMLTGTPQQVQQMAKKYRVYVSKAEESSADDDYLVDHSIVTYFHDDTGDLSDCFTQSMRASDVVERVVEKMTLGSAAPATS